MADPVPAASDPLNSAVVPSAANAPAPQGGVKETIESILIAFILAFIFRAFVVEAFVIPTGSMAPTLLGAHMRYRCTDCGYEFTVNYPTGGGDDVKIPPFARVEVRGAGGITAQPQVFNVHCPNCGYKIPRRASDGDEDNDATAPPVHYGDRILVLKYLYLLHAPARWDVVVFKSPSDPARYNYGQNYIKRLVGKPGEAIMILDGDLYVAPGRDGPWTVQTKPPVVQDALWRIVYDNDHVPRSAARPAEANLPARQWKQPWTVRSGSGWTLEQSAEPARIFTFTNPDGAAAIAFDPNANPNFAERIVDPITRRESRRFGSYALTDWLAYDVTAGYTSTPLDVFDQPEHVQLNNVSDVKLDLYYHRQSGDGPLRLTLTKRDDSFIAELTPREARLFHLRDGHRRQIGAAVRLGSGSARPVHVEFMNTDYQVTLRLDDQTVLRTTPADYHPDLDELLGPYRDEDHAIRFLPPPPATIAIEAERQSCRISHVSLWRDVYYGSGDRNSDIRFGVPKDYPNQVMVLGEDEYFVLGDNSLISGDARYWRDPIDLPYEDLAVQAGRVPGRFLLGKAFFVYWPAGYRPLPSAPGIIPNFGAMRFIH